MKANVYAYPGNELELFAHAVRWKMYAASLIGKHISGDVLEVGAGLAVNTPYLINETVQSWTLMEPDVHMAEGIRLQINAGVLQPFCRLITGNIYDMAVQSKFDSILYIDVLEHIENDLQELERASLHLKPGGKLIVLAPAHNWLMSPFDKAIGHYRRYNKKSLSALTPNGLSCIRIHNADSTGLMASMANRLFLKQKMPTEKQILFWDKWMIPFSRIIDKLTAYRLGKSVIAVWEKNQNAC